MSQASALQHFVIMGRVLRCGCPARRFLDRHHTLFSAHDLGHSAKWGLSCIRLDNCKRQQGSSTILLILLSRQLTVCIGNVIILCAIYDRIGRELEVRVSDRSHGTRGSVDAGPE
ncbi:hypothetical protein CALVIDRAFT_45224 [Calocera viscosa TUFC12733]|uniref:Uncharacterized protein n=1 Tax=Calocera viscosa (strain TUFC12733) TaxID=1330018 RepID=A0A167P473_CALVF|nr:hypothetical protein CALVIDRAFT_45224 [Calocera viscosa TUFC12733]